MASGSGTYNDTPLKDDLGAIALKWDRRPRPWPWDITVDLTCVADAVPDTFGGRIVVMAQGSYDFGDTPNWIAIEQLTIEDMNFVDKFILMFESSPDGINFTPLGAVRFARVAAVTRSFMVSIPTRPMNVDINGMYASVKSRAGAPSAVVFSMCIGRHVEVANQIPQSTGVYPTG